MTDFYKNLRAKSALIGLMCLMSGLAVSAPAYSQVRGNPNALELPAAQNKALIDGLIRKIDSESQDRQLQAIERGEELSVVPKNGQTPIVATLDKKTLYLLDESCSDLNEISDWTLLFYPLQVNTSSEADHRSPSNLKSTLKKNGSILQRGASKACMSYMTLPNEKAYKIVGYKGAGPKRSWIFEKAFAERKDYLSLNRIQSQNKLAPKGASICKVATRLCYSNTRKPEYVSDLTGKGLVGENVKAGSSAAFYLETRRSETEISALFPKFDVKVLTPSASNIANFISSNQKHTVILSVRDNAMGRLKETDLAALNRVGVDMSDVAIRGAHVSILRPGYPAINITDNKKPVSVSPEEHKVPDLGVIYSAGFAMGDNSTINLKGENISPNMRGINIAVVDSRGRMIAAQNFDTHISPNRSLGFYEARVEN